MSVLKHSEILKLMQHETPADRLIITPLLDRAQQIGTASVDVRLGSEFILLERSSVSRVDPTRKAEWRQALMRTQKRSRISLKKPFVLHPGQLVLGATLEYLVIPPGIFVSVEGRSSWGRVGLIVATASSIDPGFRGVVTLELVNAGEAPLALYVGLRVAQLVFHDASGSHAESYRGKYKYPTGPQFTKLEDDEDIETWGERKADAPTGPSNSIELHDR